jgi:SIR2-like protein
VKLDEFLRLHAVRAPNVMWFLGAGASAAAGMPTAGQMIWDFKRLLYCTEQHVPIESCADLTEPVLQARLQAHFDAEGGFPSRDNDEEYAAYFEAAYRTEGDRRRYLDHHTRGTAPSYGHYALAALLAADRVRAVWTTNMDRAVEDAWAEITGNTRLLTVATLDTADIALTALNEGRFPLLVKLHGDYQSSRLKNVGVELRAQDERLRHALVEGCRRWGLTVIGYSGRDASVMDALQTAIDGGRGFPLGLFWFHRSGGMLSHRVGHLLELARAAGIAAELIEAETFDELLDAVLLVERELPETVTRLLDARRPRRLSNAPLPTGRGGWPVIRMNALPVLEWPQTARLVRCEIGGYSEVREAIGVAGVELIAGRRRQGIIGFGTDSDMRTAFGSRPGFALDLYPIEARRLAYESAELGILYEALRRAIARVVPLVHRSGGRFLATDPAQSGAAVFEPLRRALGPICGQVPAANNTPWMEAIEIRLEFRSGRLWLILQPTVWAEAVPDLTQEEARADFIRTRLSSRYNRQANDLLVAWRDVLLGGNNEATFSAFGTDGGVDATFRIGPVSAFTRRQIAP